MIELTNEHRRYAIQRRTALGLYRLHDRQRLVTFARDDDARAMGRARQIPQHHPEAVIERHRNAHSVALRIVQSFANKEPVVQDIMMRERCTLWKTGRSR